MGEPRVLVLSSCGTGIPVYRRLQKEQVPFATAILYKNDIDYRLARLLASETVAEEPFREISEEAFARAMALIQSCERVIDAGVTIGDCNRKMEELLEAARLAGKLLEA